MGDLTDNEKELGIDEEEFSWHLGWRGWTIVVLFVGWLLWLPIWWYHLGIELVATQRMAIVMVSILLFVIVLLVLLVPWSMHLAEEEERRMWESPEFRFRFWVSTVVILGCMAVLTYGMWRFGREDDVWLGPVLIFVLLWAYAAMITNPRNIFHKEAMEE